ncbi:MAG TPA: diacylglycerol kinase family protein [Patescibacteria group bacterium]
MDNQKLRKSFKYAWRGLADILKTEQNFQIELASGLMVVVLMFYFQVSLLEAAILILTILTVLVFEIVNTVIERLVDLIKPQIHQQAGRIKDMTAAIVLVASIGAAIIGLIIFLPYFF